MNSKGFNQTETCWPVWPLIFLLECEAYAKLQLGMGNLQISVVVFMIYTDCSRSKFWLYKVKGAGIKQDKGSRRDTTQMYVEAGLVCQRQVENMHAH